MQDADVSIRGNDSGSVFTILDWVTGSHLKLRAPFGRDVSIEVGSTDAILCDNLGPVTIYYNGTGVLQTTSLPAGGVRMAQTQTGDGSYEQVLDTFSLGLDAEFWYWDYSVQVMGDPTQQRFRVNNADPTLATSMALDSPGITLRDISGLFAAIQAGTQIRITETKDLGIWIVYEATGPAVDNTTWAEIPIAYVASGNALSSTVREPMKFTFSNLASAPAVSSFLWDTVNMAFDSTTDGLTLPGAGEMNFNNATPNLVTLIQVDDADADKVRTVGDGVELIASKI